MPDSSRDPLFHENGYFDGDYPWPYSPLGNSNEIENAHIQGSNNGFNPWIPSQGEHSRSPPEDPFSRLEYDLAGVLPSPGYAAHKGLMSSGPSVLHVPPTDVPSRIPEVTFNLSSSDAPRIPTMDSSPELFVSRPSRTNNLDYVSATTSAAAPSSAITSRRRRHPSGSLSVVMPGRVEETATPLSPHLGLPFGEGTNEENLLMTLRDAGHGFTYISQQMHEQLGIEITSNALVKRYGKIQNMYMTVSSFRIFLACCPG